MYFCTGCRAVLCLHLWSGVEWYTPDQRCRHSTFGLVYTILPQITGILPQINGLVVQMQTVLTNLENTTSQLAVMDFTGMIHDVDSLVGAAQQSLELTMGKLNTIDFETLNKAIEDLAKIVEPMSKLMNVFK